MIRRSGVLAGHDVESPPQCLTCDACCCRTFPSVDLTPAEYERLQELGAQRLHLSLNGRHKLVIENGCEFLSGGRCRIYADRPLVCRRFICTS